MTTQFHRESAKIYQFPKSALRRPVVRKDDVPAVELYPSDICYAALENCWYHEEAVKEAAKDRKDRPHS